MANPASAANPDGETRLPQPPPWPPAATAGRCGKTNLADWHIISIAGPISAHDTFSLKLAACPIQRAVDGVRIQYTLNDAALPRCRLRYHVHSGASQLLPGYRLLITLDNRISKQTAATSSADEQNTAPPGEAVFVSRASRGMM